MKKPNIKLKTPQGNIAVSMADLHTHIAVAQSFGGVGGFGGYLPNPDPILKKLGKDIAVYRELLSDPIVAGHVRRRKAVVSGMSWRIEANGAPEVVVQTVTNALNRLPLYSIIKQILDAALFGYQPLEVIWKADSQWLPESIVAKPPEWFAFNEQGQLLLNQIGETPRPVPDFKFLCPTSNASYTNPYGIGDLASVYWPTVFKRGGLKFWAEFAEKFGAPWIIGREPRSNTPQDTEKLLDALEQLIGNAVASIPNDSSVEIKEAAGKQGSADIYDRFIRYCRSEIAIALLGQDQTTEKDTNHASAQAGLSVTEDIRNDDCRIVETCLNQLIDWICLFNFAEGTPRLQWVLYEEAEGDKTRAERDHILTQCGVSLSEHYWQRAYNLSETDIATNHQVATNTADFAEADHDAGSIIDTQIPDSGSLNQQGQALTAALVTELNSGGTAETLLDRLTAAYPHLDDTALQNELARLIFLSELVGRIEAAGELTV